MSGNAITLEFIKREMAKIPHLIFEEEYLIPSPTPEMMAMWKKMGLWKDYQNEKRSN